VHALDSDFNLSMTRIAFSVAQSLGWRTMLVVPEREQELEVGEATLH
jgi:hypothetical protein